MHDSYYVINCNYLANHTEPMPPSNYTVYGIKQVKTFTTSYTITGQVTRATHVRNRVCPRVELILKINQLILKIIIILLIIFLGFIKRV